MDTFVSFIADVLVLPIILIAAIAILRLPRQKRWPAIARGVVVALTALLFAKIAAQFYQGARPFVEMGVDPKASFLPNPGFPSDHALLVFVATIVVWAATQNKRLALVLLVLSTLVAAGRVLALVHTPADVIGGFVCALLAGVVWYGLRLKHPYDTHKL